MMIQPHDDRSFMKALDHIARYNQKAKKLSVIDALESVFRRKQYLLGVEEYKASVMIDSHELVKAQRATSDLYTWYESRLKKCAPELFERFKRTPAPSRY